MHSPLHLHAFQQAVNPTALMRIQAAKQQDALAIHTTAQHQIWQQQRLDKLAAVAEDGRAWVSVADGVSSSPCADFASLPAAQLQALWRADQSPADNLAALHQAWQRAGGPDDISVLALCSTTG